VTDTSATVIASAVTKHFGRRAAVAGVDLSLLAGGTLALFGPNGAGKTTLLRLLAGVLKPTSGAVRIDGVDARARAEVRARIGLISHHSMLYAALTPLENVEFSARLYGVAHARQAALDALAAMQIGEHARVPARTLSRGLLQRVSIARAIVHRPAVLLLDEPYSGLDAGGAAALTRLLQELSAGGTTMVIVTHNVMEGLALATHAAIMVDGRFVRSEERTGAGFDVDRYATAYREMMGLGGGGGRDLVGAR
jgi:heme exporter protein A